MKKLRGGRNVNLKENRKSIKRKTEKTSAYLKKL